VFLFFGAFNLWAQDSYKISVELDGYTKDTLILGYYLGNNQYVKDTTVRHKNKFVFEADSLLPIGMYMVIVPPHNDIIQILLDKQDQQFNITATYDNGLKDIRFKGSEENSLYYSYVNFIQEKRPKSNELRALLDSLDESDERYQSFKEKLLAIDNEVQLKTDQIISEYPESYTSLILRTNAEIEIPEFEGEKSEVELKRFHYFKKHYFDKMYLSDPRMFRTPYLFERTDYYTDKLTMRNPDSIALSVDEILMSLQNNEDAFQYYLVHFLNKYAKSKVVGQDGVYVHIADNYYAKGLAPWTEAEQLNKILKNANELRPTLLGKIAPDLTLENQAGEKIQIHDIDAEFTVLYFWNPDCGHCKKSTPKIIEFYNAYKDKGVKVATICGKTGKDLGECWKYVNEKEGMDVLYNLADQFYRSKFKSVYYVKTTPKIYVLDKDKKILSKGIGAEQLPDLMDYLLKKEEIK
jgi:thiol-disulfide isomerase/thioredoxin